MKNKKAILINLVMALILILGIGAMGLFTAFQMGAFYNEPQVEVKAQFTTEDAPVLAIATDYDFCPNSYYNSDGELSGLYIETIIEAANRLKMNPQFLTDNWLGCRENLTNGTADVLLGLEIFSNMEGTLRTIPICSDELKVYGKRKVYSAAALSGKKIALMARSVIISMFDLNCEYVEYTTNTEILEAVENGDVDYGICHGAVAEKIIEKNGFDLQAGMALMKSFPALAVKDTNPALQKQLNTVLQEMAEDGTLYQFKTKWIDEFTEDRTFLHVIDSNLPVYCIWVVGSVILLAILIFFQVDLKKQNQYIETLLDYQKQLQESNTEIARANRAKTEFLSHMSHDIRTPMNGIMGMAKMIRNNIENPEQVISCLDKIDMSSGHLLSLLNDVLDMSRVESGSVELEHVTFCLDEEILYLHTIMDGKIEEKKLSFSVDDRAVTHKWLIGSPVHFRRILLNLVSNAVKYTHENGIVSVSFVEQSAGDKNEYGGGQKEKYKNEHGNGSVDSGDMAWIQVTVQDNGIGMSKEFLEHSLYKPFMQENDTVRTKYQGTGLGMAIVHEFVEAMQGHIQVQSKQGKGTKFIVTIPFAIAKTPMETQEKESRENDAQKVTDKTIRGMRILLAEDNMLNREIAQSILEDAGVSVVAVEDGAEAVAQFEKMSEGSFDAILMDVMMPNLDGLEATKKIRSMERTDAKNIPIIAMTANAFDEDRKKTAEAGMNEHLNKPVDADQLVETLAKFF